MVLYLALYILHHTTYSSWHGFCAISDFCLYLLPHFNEMSAVLAKNLMLVYSYTFYAQTFALPSCRNYLYRNANFYNGNKELGTEKRVIASLANYFLVSVWLPESQPKINENVTQQTVF